MAAFDPVFTPLEGLIDDAAQQLARAVQLIRQDFPHHAPARVEQFVKFQFQRTNSPGINQPFFVPEWVAQAYRAAHPGEQPAPAPVAMPASPNAAAVPKDGSDDLIYDDL